jgi:adenylosuccinate lyase
MIERYADPVINSLWDEQSKINNWTLVEKAACITLHKRGKITDEEIEAIKEAPAPTIDKVKKLEKITDHDVAAFVQALAQNCGKAGRHIHKGLTSSDICDTAQAIAIKRSLQIIIEKLNNFGSTLRAMAEKYKRTPCIGRTHGVHAEITTFGIRIAGWYAELHRNLKRLRVIRDGWRAKLSGAVGTYSQTDPEFEEKTLKQLCLIPEKISTQIIPRDRHAELLSALALVGGLLERIALEIRSLQRTEIREVEEGFKSGQKGSSAMPHKHNPISSEKVCGLARILRGHMLVAHENMALWHDRDISHSSTERIIIPDAFHLLAHMIKIMDKKVFANLQVFPDNMMKNIMKTGGAVFSQNVLTFLLSHGYSREKAYKIVQQCAQLVLEGKHERMIDAISYMFYVGPDAMPDLNKCFDIENYLVHVDSIFRKVFWS